MATTSNGSIRPRQTITAGGRTRELTLHAMVRMRVREIPEAQVAYVLDNWQLRGTDTTPGRKPSFVYFAYIPDADKVLKVAVSIDDERITTTHFDTRATKDFRRGTRDYFLKYEDLEERDEGNIRRTR